jgi:hypothetical protein
MKTQRTILVTLLASAGLVLAVSSWHFSRLMPPPAGEVTPQDSSYSAEQPLVREHRQMADGSDQSRGATNTMKAPPAPFLQAVTAKLESIQNEPDSRERNRRLESLANEMHLTQTVAVVEFLKESAFPESASELSLRLVRRWAEVDPRTAADWVNRAEIGPVRQQSLEAVAIAWANQNLSEAVEWARQLDDDAERHSGLKMIAYEAARTEPVEALRIAAELPAGDNRDDLMAHSISQWAATDPEAAAVWGREIDDAAFRERVLAQIAIAWADRDPVAAATLALGAVTLGRQQDDAVVSIVQRWVQHEPVQAATWVAEFPEGALRDAALQEVVKLWADQDLEDAGQWLNGLADGPSRDIAVEAYAAKKAARESEMEESK